MAHLHTIPVREVRRGDEFVVTDSLGDLRVVWRALSDANEEPDHTAVSVQHFPDGGIDYRTWDNPSYLLEIRRPT